MRDRTVTVWCEPRIAIYSAKPIIDKYHNQGRTICVVVRACDKEIAQEYFGERIDITTIESIDSKIRKALHYFVTPILVPNDFSSMYERIRKKQGGWSYFAGKYIGNMFSRLNFNKLYFRIFALFPSRLPSQFVISLTRASTPYLLASSKYKHISIMESWDHPIKAPYFLWPSRTLTWNKSLRNDIYYHQGLNYVRYITPLKLRYVNEYSRYTDEVLLNKLPKKYKNEIEELLSSDYVLYPATTSSVNPVDHEGEMKLIRDLLCVFHDSGIKFYIKPKPNGPVGDYNVFRKHDSVYVGAYSTDPAGDDMLNEEYHIFRYLLLRHATLLINVATTFVLEGALAKTPILQLVLTDGTYGHFEVLSKNLHSMKYLLSRRSVCHYGGDQHRLRLHLKSNKSLKYSEELLAWIREA